MIKKEEEEIKSQSFVSLWTPVQQTTHKKKKENILVTLIGLN